MGQERAAILDVSKEGTVELPLQFKGKLRLSKKVYVSVCNTPAGSHIMTINQNPNNPNNKRDTRTNKIIQYDYNDGIIPVDNFIGDEQFSEQVVVWFNEDTKELVFQCVFSN